MIYLPTKNEEYFEAEKKLDILLKASGTSFKQLALQAIYEQLGDVTMQVPQAEALYRTAQEIMHDTPDGEKAVRELKEELVLKFMSDQREYESEN